jgi:hypothetical protein
MNHMGDRIWLNESIGFVELELFVLGLKYGKLVSSRWLEGWSAIPLEIFVKY